MRISSIKNLEINTSLGIEDHPPGLRLKRPVNMD